MSVSRRNFGVPRKPREDAGFKWLRLTIDIIAPIFWGLLIALCIVLYVLAQSLSARSQETRVGDYGVGHEQYHPWYQTGERGGPLMRPAQPSMSCCDGDCRPTTARLIDGCRTKQFLERGNGGRGGLRSSLTSWKV